MLLTLFGDLMFLQKIPAPDMIEFICRRFAETGKSIGQLMRVWSAVTRPKAALIEKNIIDTLSPRPTIQDSVFAYWLKHNYFV